MATVKRSVFFWQVTTPKGDPLPGVFPGRAIARTIGKIGVVNSAYESADGWRLMAQALKDTSPQHVVLYRVRRENLPFIEQSGAFSDLQLEEDQNLAEATHMRFFPRNVVGLLHNHDGPRITRFEQFLAGKLNVHVGFAPVLRGNPGEALDRLSDVSAVEFKIPVGAAHMLSSNDSAIRALREMAEESLAKTLYVKMTLWGSPSPQGPAKWKSRVKKILNSAMFDGVEGVKVRGWDSASATRQTVDLVAEQLTMRQDVELTSAEARAVQNSSAAAAIESAYSSMKELIDSAVPSSSDPVPNLKMQDLGPS